MRGRPLDRAEREKLRPQLASRAWSDVYKSYVDAWFDRSFFNRLGAARARAGNGSQALFMGELRTFKDPTGADVFYHPAIEGENRSSCASSQPVQVIPWWDTTTTVRVCPNSYRPEKAFDTVGYCGGRSELPTKQSPRPNCGCGPLLLACLPPSSDELIAHFDSSNAAEVANTFAEVIDRGRPFSEVFTTSTTWQDGYVQFLYRRRDALSLLANEPYSKNTETKIVKMLSAPLSAPGRWVDRKGVYSGSGLFLTTPLIQVSFPTYRTVVRAFLQNAACITLVGVNVDSASLLEGVGKQHGDLRLFEINESPMRTTTGCSGCHAPMDNAAGFLLGMKTPLFGDVLTGKKAVGQLYLKGANDLRGAGEGFSGLTSLMVAQPEYRTCAVTGLAGSVGVALDEDEIPRVAESFRADKENAKNLLRKLLMRSVATK